MSPRFCGSVMSDLLFLYVHRGRTHQKKWREVDALIELSYTRIVKYIDSWEEEASAEWWSHDGAKRYEHFTESVIVQQVEFNVGMRHKILHFS